MCSLKTQGFQIEDGILKQYTGESRDVTIPDGIREIGVCAFRGSNVNQVTIPGSVKAIGAHAFEHSLLKRVILPDSLEQIGTRAFFGCWRLDSLSIPERVKTFKSGAFSKCEKLRTAGPIGSGCCIEFGHTAALPDKMFCSMETLESIQIPDGIQSIGEFCFYWCNSLTEVVLPDSVTEIRSNAFEGCRRLQRITLPDRIEHIGEDAIPLETEVLISPNASEPLKAWMRTREEAERIRNRKVVWEVSEYAEAMDAFAAHYKLTMSRSEKDSLLAFMRAFVRKTEDVQFRFSGYAFELQHWETSPGYHEDHNSETSVSLRPIAERKDGWIPFTREIDEGTGDKPRILPLLAPCREVYAKIGKVWDHNPGIFGTSFAPGVARFCVLDPPGLNGWFELEYTIERN